MEAESRPDPRFGIELWAVIGAGAAIATVLAAVTRGEAYDMESFRLVRDALDVAPLHVYSSFEARGIVRWPYPPGFFPWIDVAGRLDGLTSFDFLVRVPSIAAAAAIAWVVQDFLGRRGAGARTRLAAAAAISLGPSVLMTAGVHGQFDTLAILPGVIAVSVWDRSPAASRAAVAGLLVGTGGALKTVPLLLVLALLPSARSWREAALLLAATAAPLAIVFAPLAVEGTLPAAKMFEYRGLPGVGGLSLLVQPNIPLAVLGIDPIGFNGANGWLAEHGNLVVIAGLLAVAAVGLRSRAPAVDLSVLLWLAVYAFGVNFFFQYMVWGLPFFLMAGYVREAVAIQALLLGPAILFYLRPWDVEALGIAYAALMLVALAAAVAGFVVVARRLLTGRRAVREPRSHSSAAGAGVSST